MGSESKPRDERAVILRGTLVAAAGERAGNSNIPSKGSVEHPSGSGTLAFAWGGGADQGPFGFKIGGEGICPIDGVWYSAARVQVPLVAVFGASQTRGRRA